MRLGFLFSLLAFVAGFAVAPARADDSVLAAALENLKSKSFRTKATAVAAIAESGGDPARRILSGLLEGQVYLLESADQLVIAEHDSEGYSMSEVSTGAGLGRAEKSELKRVIINNKMRGALRIALARLSLRATDPSERRRTVKSLYASLSDNTVELLREVLLEERDAGVQRAISVALALADLESPERERRSSAIEMLSGSLHTEVRNQLVRHASGDPDTEPKEPDLVLRAAAATAVETIDGKRRMYGMVETVFFGVSLGFVLVLAATGLAITFGVMGVINMAHGELMMLGAYSTWVVQQAMPDHIEFSLFAAIPVAFAVSALAGVAIERGVVRFLYGRPLETLLATFGVSLVLQQAVRSIFSPLNRDVATPDWMSGQLVINDALALTNNRLYIILFSIGVFISLVGILRFTTLGLQIRAVSQNRDMARAMGVRGAWIDATTFGLGAGVAGLAGVALSQLTNVGPNLGQSHIVDSFMVVVFGGVGNLWGTLVAGLSLGIVSKGLEPFVGAVPSKILVLFFIILFIQRRPRGLFPQKGRAAEA